MDEVKRDALVGVFWLLVWGAAATVAVMGIAWTLHTAINLGPDAPETHVMMLEL